MPFKPVGVDENGRLPDRAMKYLDDQYAGLEDFDNLASIVDAATPESEVVLRTNHATSPHGDKRGWYTSGGYNSQPDPIMQRRFGIGTRKHVKSSSSRYTVYGRGAGQSTINPTTSAANGEGVIGLTPVNPGESWGLGLYLRSQQAQLDSYVVIRWCDAAGNIIGTTTGPKSALPANEWKWTAALGTAPVGSYYLSFEYVLDQRTDAGANNAGVISWAGDALIEKRTTIPTNNDYFDGTYTLNGSIFYSFTGDFGLSSSIQARSGALAKRDASGNLAVTLPIKGTSATPKSYVDRAVATMGDTITNVSAAPYYVQPNDDSVFNMRRLQEAFDAGGFILIPEGLWWIENHTIGSHTHVFGMGRKTTTLKVKNGAAWNSWGIINKDYVGGTTSNWSLNNMTVDGNQPNRPATGGTGGFRGTTVTAANTSYVWFNNVESISAMQHNFDVTSNDYTYGLTDSDDTRYSTTPSRFVWYNDCRADLHGDDGFTSHGSEYIWYDNCWAGGTWKATLTTYTNSNGFEFDDGSRHIWATNCYAEQNAHGFEIKAHGNAPAAYDVHLISCVAKNNQVNFSVRHIGFHTAGQPRSTSAKRVSLISCVSIHPIKVFTGTGAGESDSDDTTLRSLSIGAYRGVNVLDFWAIGDPTYDYGSSATIVFEFKSEDIIFAYFHIEGFVKNTHYDIYAKGGDQPTHNVTIGPGTIKDSAVNGISAGSASEAYINQVRITRNVPGSSNGTGIAAFGNNTIRSCFGVQGMAPNFNISGGLFEQYETPLRPNVAWSGAPVG